MKKFGVIIGFIVLIAIIVGGRLYKKHERQRIREEQQKEQQKEQREWLIEGQKRRQVLQQQKQDSIKLSKPTKLDSARLELDKKRKKMQETIKRLNKESKKNQNK